MALFRSTFVEPLRQYPSEYSYLSDVLCTMTSSTLRCLACNYFQLCMSVMKCSHCSFLSFLSPNLWSLPQACSRSQKKISRGQISRPIQLPLCELETFWLPQTPNHNSSHHGGRWDPSFPLPCTAAWASQAALVVKNRPASAEDARDMGSIPESGRSPGRGHGNPTLVFLPGESHGQRSLAGYSP